MSTAVEILIYNLDSPALRRLLFASVGCGKDMEDGDIHGVLIFLSMAHPKSEKERRSIVEAFAKLVLEMDARDAITWVKNVMNHPLYMEELEMQKELEREFDGDA